MLDWVRVRVGRVEVGRWGGVVGHGQGLLGGVVVGVRVVRER